MLFKMDCLYKNVYIYVRKPAMIDQHKIIVGKKYSIDYQLDIINKFCKNHGVNIIDTIIDNFNVNDAINTIQDRNILNDMLVKIPKYHTIVCYSPSILSYSMEILGEIKNILLDKKCGLVFLEKMTYSTIGFNNCVDNITHTFNEYDYNNNINYLSSLTKDQQRMHCVSADILAKIETLNTMEDYVKEIIYLSNQIII